MEDQPKTHINLEKDSRFSKDIEALKSKIRTYNGFPKPGVTYKDAFDIIKDINDFKKVIEIFSQVIRPIAPDYIVGIESRGFILASALSHALNIPFVLIRKKNKLPGQCQKVLYKLHYGQDCLEIQENCIQPGERVIIVDDAVATGGTLNAAINLLNSVGVIIVRSYALISLNNLNWETLLKDQSLTTLLTT